MLIQRYLTNLVMLFFAIFTVPLNAEEFSIDAETLVYNAKNDLFVADGKVTISIAGINIRTDNLTYNNKQETIRVRSKFFMKTQQGVRILSSFAEVDRKTRKVIAKNIKALIQKKFQIASKKVLIENNKTIFTKAVGTPCEICRLNPEPSWILRAEKLIHDKETKKLHFYNTYLEIFGVPILYTPYLQTPEPGVKRASGLLAPSFLSSDILGTGVRQPFFFTLGNSSDFTLSIIRTSKINFLIENQYRKLFNMGDLKLESAFIPPSNGGSIKGFLKIKGNLHINKKRLLNIDTTLISDTAFLGKYGYDDRDRFLNSLSYKQFGKKKLFQASAIYHTSLRDSNIIEPLIMPSLEFRKYKKFKNSGLILQEEYSVVGLSRKEGSGYTRLSSDLNLRKQWTADNGLLINGTGNILTAGYLAEEINSSRYMLKVYPLGALEFKYPLYKERKNTSEIIIPTAQLIYSSDSNPKNDPRDEDSSTTEFDSTTLFKLKKIPGKDRQEEGLRLNTGIEYSSEKDNSYNYSLSIGQIFRNKNSKDFILSSGLNGFESDILLSGRVNLKKDLEISSKQVYSKNFSLKRSDTSFLLKTSRYKVLGNFINLLSDPSEGTNSDLKELTLDLDSKFSSNWSGSFGLRRNLVNNENINASFGLNFKDDCIDIGLSLSRRNTASSLIPKDSRIDLVVNFGNIGSRYKSTKFSRCAIQ
ncbi:LPS assembly protein LptD [Paracoccaceae bacterium]|nr:LPS assembly protein LptD [Paracoccaceae bacterium]